MSKSKAEKEVAEGWQRFEMAVDAAIRSGPKHKPGKADKASQAGCASEGKKARAKRGA